MNKTNYFYLIHFCNINTISLFINFFFLKTQTILNYFMDYYFSLLITQCYEKYQKTSLFDIYNSLK